MNNIKDIKEEQFVELFDAFKRNENLESFSAVNCDIRFGSSIKFFKFLACLQVNNFLETSRLASFFSKFVLILQLPDQLSQSQFFHFYDWLRTIIEVVVNCLKVVFLRPWGTYLGKCRETFFGISNQPITGKSAQYLSCDSVG